MIFLVPKKFSVIRARMINKKKMKELISYTYTIMPLYQGKEY